MEGAGRTFSLLAFCLLGKKRESGKNGGREYFYVDDLVEEEKMYVCQAVFWYQVGY